MLYDLLKQYTELPGPVGHEELIADRVRKDWEPVCERVWETRVGNVLAKVGGCGPKLLITAHLDEINLLVKSITHDGFLLLTQGTGGSEPTVKPNPTFVGQRALVKGKDEYVPGQIAAATGHIKTAAQRAKDGLDWDDFFLDLGLSSVEEVAALGIHPGSPVIYTVETRRMGHHIVGKAMDDRAGLALMTAMARELRGKELHYELYFAATIQEEIGLGGAMSVAKEADFDLAIALEIGLVGDIPTVKDSYMPSCLGKGPIIAHKDARIHYSEKVANKLIAAADRIGHPLQHAVFHGFGSDGDQLIRAGIPTALFTFPTRYTHSPYEMVNEQDLQSMLAIMKELVLRG